LALFLDGSERYSGGVDKRKRLQIELSRQERKQVEELLSGGVQPVRAVIHRDETREFWLVASVMSNRSPISKEEMRALIRSNTH
jgi:hypothetical protein